MIAEPREEMSVGEAWTLPRAAAEATRLLHNMSPWVRDGQMIDHQYNLSWIKRCHCLRPNCGMELVLVGNHGLYTPDCIFYVCQGDGVPPGGEHIVTGRQFKHGKRVHTHHLGKPQLADQSYLPPMRIAVPHKFVLGRPQASPPTKQYLDALRAKAAPVPRSPILQAWLAGNPALPEPDPLDPETVARRNRYTRTQENDDTATDSPSEQRAADPDDA